MNSPLLTPHQLTAIDWLVDRLCQQEPGTVVALRGYAGTGKTTLIPALRDCLSACGLATAVGSPTHRAAMILRKKGILDADTLHAHALTPAFTPDYTRACAWLTGEELPCREADQEGAPFPTHDDVNGIPWLIHERLGEDVSLRRDLRRRAGFYGAKKALQSIGIYGRDHFAGFGPKFGEGCLIIDEASMLGTDQLALCQEAFPLLCLIGDPGQLPPVKDHPALADVEGFHLTEVHRQAADSPILQLATQAREGLPFWQRIPATPGLLEEWQRVDASALLESPLIVWRNKTRIDCTHLIRAQLGYTRDAVAVGEPLVCRSTDQEDRTDGFFNNALFRIVEISSADPRKVTVQEDCTDKTQEVTLHLEELDGDNIDPKAVPFRLGYCLTAHTAQGGEWPTVYISKPDMLAYAGFCQRDPRRAADFAKWAYTAITRAKQTLGFLTTHAFDRACRVAVPAWGERSPMATPKPGPTTAPMMTMPSPAETDPGVTHPLATPPELDDIVDPMVPADALPPGAASPVAPAVPCTFNDHEALLSGFCQALQGQLMRDVTDQAKGTLRIIDALYGTVTDRLTKLAADNEHATYQLSETLARMSEPTVLHNPYKATVDTLSPQGFPVVLEIAKRDAGELVQALDGLTAWLQQAGYAVPEGVRP